MASNQIPPPLSKATPQDLALLDSAHAGDELALADALAAGARVDARGYGTYGDMTPAMFAAWSDRDACLRALIDAGADIDATAPNGWTCAMIAALNGHEACLRALIAAGADLHAKDDLGHTAALFAATYGRAACLQSLLAAGADINAKSHDGKTAAMLAATHGHDACLRALLDGGAIIDAQDGVALIDDQDGRALIDDQDAPLASTALMLAAERGHEACLRALIAAGSNIHTQDALCRTAAQRAVEFGSPHLAALIQSLALARDEAAALAATPAASPNSSRRLPRI